MKKFSEKEIAKDIIKNIHEDQKRRKGLLDSIPEGENKEVAKQIEIYMQTNEKNIIENLKGMK